MALTSSFNKGGTFGLTPSYGALSQGSVGGWSPAAVQSGRSWMDPNRYNERMARLAERQARNPAPSRSSSGGSAAAAAPQDLPEGVAQTNATTGQIVTVLPPTMTGQMGGGYNRKVYERLGARFEPEVGIYDPRTGLSRKVSASEAIRQGLLGSAQRALLEGLNRGQTFSRTNPFV
jgi:hypothetical protein